MNAPHSARYAELQVTTNYSFLRGGSHPAELVQQAHALGMTAIAVTDRNSVAGVVRAFDAARELGLRFIVGCRLDLLDGSSFLCFPQDRAAYSRLTRLLSVGKLRAGKGQCHLNYSDVVEYGDGQLIVALGDKADSALKDVLQRIARDFPKRSYMALTRRFRPDEALRLHEIATLAANAGVPTVVTNDVLHHIPERRLLQDVLTCIREGVAIDQLGYKRELSADRFLKPPQEMYRLFPRYTEAVERSGEIADRCTFALSELEYQYPDENLIPGLTAQQALEKCAYEGAQERYPKGVPAKVLGQIEYELKIINDLNYAPYFLTVHRVVKYARRMGILCQGRGSAANSTVCFCLGVTEADPEVSQGLLFERFISKERGEPPDIDIDFEHERREEIIQWVYETYGLKHAALTSTVVHYRNRRAVREVGKALGLSEDVTGALSGSVWGWGDEGIPEAHAREIGLDPSDYRLDMTLKLAGALVGFPRHLSQHPGGFVIARDRLDDLVPIEPATMKDRWVVEWDKDDLEALKMMKVDFLALGMLSCLRRSFDLLKAHKGVELSIASIPQEDPKVYEMLCEADSIGVFQVESRAQMNMLPRLKPKTLYDLVIEVAIVRPGPIQGNMVHPYLRRRDKIEAVTYPKEELREVLDKTLGIPLFQEQAMRIAIVGAKFTPGEADGLRRAMATFRNEGSMPKFERRFVDGMVANGYERDFAQRCFNQIKGFGTYGFPESHAASFAILVYASSWVKCHHPDVFLCAILNSQPMGFYAPAQLIRDAQNHGVIVRPVDVNASAWDCTLEPAGGQYLAVRIGYRFIKGLSEAAAADILKVRHAPYASIEDVLRRSGVKASDIECMAEADAFACFGIDRRKAAWIIKGLRTDQLPLFAAAEKREASMVAELSEPSVTLPRLSAGAEVREDYLTLSFSLRQHPLAFLRTHLLRDKWATLKSLDAATNESHVRIAGLVLVRQRPGSAKGVTFMTLEDETASANIVVWPDLFEKYRRVIMTSGLIACAGRVQKVGQITHVVAQHLEDLTPLLRQIDDEENATFKIQVVNADEALKPNGADQRGLRPSIRGPVWKHPRTINVVADHAKPSPSNGNGLRLKSRDFH
jgi:error-prone DNA polymerase